MAWGEYTYHILQQSNPRQLHLFDIWTGINVAGTCISGSTAFDRLARLEQQFASNFKAGQLVLHQGYIADTLSILPDGFFDWIYLGAECSAKAASTELPLCARKLKPNGFLVRQDYIKPSQESQVKYYWNGLAEAVDEFCAKDSWEIVCVTDICDPEECSAKGERGYGFDPGGDAVPCCVMRRRA